ncbi:oligosaccharide flippase family protein [Patescibacteria group bacterium]|nr:oligosaccharide flippase family protein [Patescibacteria group bacterium]
MISTAKNTFYLVIAYVYQKLIALLYFIFLARYLGAINFGKYTFAITFVAFFSILIDFGLFPVLTREIARNKSNTIKYFGNILLFSIIIGLATFFLIYWVVNFFEYEPILKTLVYVSFLIVFLDTLALLIYHVFRGFLNLKFESIGIIVHKTVMLLSGLFLIYFKADLIWLMMPLLIGAFFYLGNAIFFLKKELNIWPIPRFDWPKLKPLLILAWPFFIAMLFGKIYGTADTILLKHISGDKFVGWYMASQKLAVSFLVLVAGSLGTVLYPAFSYYFVRSKKYLNDLFHKGIFYLMFIAIPLVFGFLLLSKEIILFIYGKDYLSARFSLIFISLAIPFMFFDYIIAGFLNACDKQKANTLVHGLGAALFVIFNLIFIPLYQHNGAALSVLLGFFMLFLFEVYLSSKIIKIRFKYFFKKIGLSIICSIAMIGLLLVIKEKVHILISVSSGIIVYFASALLFGLITKQEIMFVKDIIKIKKKNI